MYQPTLTVSSRPTIFLKMTETAEIGLFDNFKPYSGPGEPGFFFDFLGTKTRIGYLPVEAHWLSGKVFGFPQRNNLILFEFEE